QFADFFLRKVLGQFNLIDDLSTLDPVLYKNLMFLKRYDGNVDELNLNFSVVIDEYGEKKVIELIPNGSNTPVTAENRTKFIHLMADYKLNRQLQRQSNAF